ncbi:hypothetical protein CSB45_08810 [candidate division KSB3 bacterium]|uniref:Uncharacterized protein n=1 Tax=candidate division KSB3 bacterium TaxID=2044937 RepID=A0A2G6E4M5_9BACT|nr:MAG: hypothetical protein CSB45_08810 [candidate division KSB3 bacterium]
MTSDRAICLQNRPNTRAGTKTAAPEAAAGDADSIDLMKNYIRDAFGYLGCEVRDTKNGLAVTLSADMSAHFGRKSLKLVFRPEDMEADTELAAYGSYLHGRLYELLKPFGQRVAFKLPRRIAGYGTEQLVRPWRCALVKHSSRSLHGTEAFLTFRVAYYSKEKQEELMTVGCDVQGRCLGNVDFPYSPSLREDIDLIRFPLSKKQAKALYKQCLDYVESHAAQRASDLQQELAAHYHQDVMRLEGYYRQSIGEIPDSAADRDDQTHQLQQEYEQKVAEELQHCHVQVSIEAISFCAVKVPVRRSRYVLAAFSKRTQIIVESFYNLFSGAFSFPLCAVCAKEMRDVGICDRCAEAVCRDCLCECHRCGKLLCTDCGIKRCAECGQWTCRDCAADCHLCGRHFCAEHLLGCLECRRHVCSRCRQRCPECHDVVGHLHMLECELSHEKVCLNCLVTCHCCDKHLRRSRSQSCSFCGQQMCDECSFRCDLCDKLFCVYHVTECEISGSMTCPQHSAVCFHCSRRISSALTHPCDLCRKQLCDACSVICHGCGLSFCEDHAAEIRYCPGCGQGYCALCWSGRGVCPACRTADSQRDVKNNIDSNSVTG